MNATPSLLDELTDDEMGVLVSVAERAVRSAVLERRTWWPDPADVPANLRRPAAAFVTLRLHGNLRGCIGTFDAFEPLVMTVASRARAAALRDPRFAPVMPDEVGALEVEVSVLGAPEPMPVRSFAELRTEVRPGVDGLVVTAGLHRATLLPAVWHDLPDVDEFLGALWRKAGLEREEWPRGIEVARYAARLWPPA